jgi:hypothetical protein
MAKRLSLIVAMLFIPTLAKADSFLQVDFSPTIYHALATGPNGNPDASNPATWETISLSFTWDTTTNALSNIDLDAVGPWAPGLSGSTPFLSVIDSRGIVRLIFNSPTTELLIESDGEGPFVFAQGSAGFTQDRPLWFYCDGCNPAGEGEHDWFMTVTSLGDGDHDKDDPVATPEPGTLTLLGAGLLGLVLIKKL